MGYMCLFQCWLPQGICLGVGLLGHMVVLFLVFKGISILFSIVAVSIYIPTNSARVFPFLHILSTIYCLEFLMMAILSVVRWYLIVVLICISLITMSDVEHLFMCLLAICMSSSGKCLFKSFSHFLTELFVFWHWVVWPAWLFWKLILCQLFHLLLFSPIWGLSFHLAYRLLCCAKTFTFNQVPLVYFCFYFHYSRRWVIEDLALIHVIQCFAYVFHQEFYSFWSYI